ncbi:MULTISPECIES: fumarylacetoacetate hydrolase family protein [unclassified Achromobacter]|uniref:fumarylacetoacetate hydrolase family protein n=1 Tax=unclassified Achromobacter TaxID=2626865 RepID=UPI000B5164F4|nr:MULTISPECIES: fumarylacetoacetate hydrolase family protein [unclassified Achromobacter]OWT72779.1 2-hydroxyhepta-2,4-diene-1,7-dioate isomerase [Achromobacter sp. HZ34]OWT73998.1 2-hydroxyhepta-2,4-diene-1,7-dioate isomerase [Achromobacter sp. HZ28]
MKLLSFEYQGRASYGLLRGDDEIVDLGALGHASLREAIAAGALPDLARRAAALAASSAAAGTPLRLADVQLLPPIPAPEKIICVGVNYGNRNEEYKDGSAPPAYPSVFPRFPGSFVGHGQALLRPRVSRQLDYEGEIALVIGKRGRHIPAADAWSHVAGLTCCNEGTVRDWVRHGKFNVTQGKNFDASGSMGPWMVTADEFDPAAPLTVTTRVNGEQRQHDTTANLMFPFAELIRYISLWTALEPGDVISTGTPVGAGVRFDPPRYLKPGDVVEVEVPGIGTLSNTVADEPGAAHAQ